MKPRPLTVVTWNVQTLLDTGTNNQPKYHTALVAAELACYINIISYINIDIAALSETRFPDERCPEEVGESYTFL